MEPMNSRSTYRYQRGPLLNILARWMLAESSIPHASRLSWVVMVSLLKSLIQLGVNGMSTRGRALSHANPQPGAASLSRDALMRWETLLDCATPRLQTRVALHRTALCWVAQRSIAERRLAHCF